MGDYAQCTLLVGEEALRRFEAKPSDLSKEELFHRLTHGEVNRVPGVRFTWADTEVILRLVRLDPADLAATGPRLDPAFWWPTDGVAVGPTDQLHLRRYGFSTKCAAPVRWLETASRTHPCVRLSLLWIDGIFDACGQVRFENGECMFEEQYSGEDGKRFMDAGRWRTWLAEADGWLLAGLANEQAPAS